MRYYPALFSALFLALLLIIGPSPVLADEIGDPRVGTEWPELKESRDPQMQEALLAAVRRLGYARIASNRNLALALVDITNLDNPRMASVNSFQMMYSASLPKIAILLGAFQKADDNKMVLDAYTRERMAQMIRKSSNSAATEILERVGFQYLADVLESDRYKLYDRDLNGGLWVGKAYAKGGVWRRDPLNNLSHGATPFEVARFYYLLATGRLVSPEDSVAMLEMLGKPKITHKFVLGLKQRPGSKIHRKSGTWLNYHSDSALIERDGRRYIAVGLVHDGDGNRMLSRLVLAMDDIIFSPENVARDGIGRHILRASTIGQ